MSRHCTSFLSILHLHTRALPSAIAHVLLLWLTIISGMEEEMINVEAAASHRLCPFFTTGVVAMPPHASFCAAASMMVKLCIGSVRWWTWPRWGDNLKAEPPSHHHRQPLIAPPWTESHRRCIPCHLRAMTLLSELLQITAVKIREITSRSPPLLAQQASSFHLAWSLTNDVATLISHESMHEV